MFQLIFHLSPDFDCSYSFALSWVDRVTTGTHNFVSVIANVPATIELYQWQGSSLARITSGLFQNTQRHFKSPPKVTEVFQLYSYFSIFCINSNWGSSLLFLTWIWRIQNLLYYHLDNLFGTAIYFLMFWIIINVFY